MGNAQIESSLDEIIVRLGKLVTGNAANFDELREIRICVARREQWDRWEYREEYYGATCGKSAEEYANDMGAKGWEIISIMPRYMGGCAFWFKRRVGPNG